jgi:uncharacterized membrane protein YkgB
MTVSTFDLRALHIIRKWSEPMARFGLAICFIWFGMLKVLGLSPATGLVHALFDQTIPFLSFDYFYIAFALFEVLIGILFLIKGCERVVFPLLLLHMFTTFLPLIFVPHIAWTGFLVPTLEGQYIIKNFVLIAAAMGIVAHLHPLRSSQ